MLLAYAMGVNDPNTLWYVNQIEAEQHREGFPRHFPMGFLYTHDSLHLYETQVTGRLYPERADDVAWENEKVGFRIYGPATQAKGERSFGYDIFFKYPDKGLVL